MRRLHFRGLDVSQRIRCSMEILNRGSYQRKSTKLRQPTRTANPIQGQKLISVRVVVAKRNGSCWTFRGLKSCTVSTSDWQRVHTYMTPYPVVVWRLVLNQSDSRWVLTGFLFVIDKYSRIPSRKICKVERNGFTYSLDEFFMENGMLALPLEVILESGGFTARTYPSETPLFLVV